ncbi:MAG: ImmA/IrrE family metallo-endopeptidase [Piscinibacter sp.]|nr:ImmA/IrrE family metallo-endopeptidase [Piscinibacter sakaiensis]
MTEAAYEFRRRMENAPPWAGPPRLRPALGLIRGRERVHFVCRFPALGALQVGEPGDARPRAECAGYEDGSAFVLVSGGLLDFIDAALGALVSGANLTVGSGAPIPAASTPEAVDQALDAVYDSWGSRWRNEHVSIVLTPLAAETADLLTQLSLATRLFVLLHEIGHAVLHTGVSPAERSVAQELEADGFALDACIDHFGQPCGRTRAALAGAFLVPRLLEALRLLGHRFPDTHPSPADRLESLRRRFRERCDSEFTYYFHTTVAIAQGLRMEAAERRLLGFEPRQPLVSAESLVSTMMGMLIELGGSRKSVTFEAAASNLLSLCDDAQPEELERAAALARAVFSAEPGVPAPADEPRAGICLAYGKLVAALPAPLPGLFLEEGQ